MKLTDINKHKTYFKGVALATILCGAVILALGLVEWGMNYWGSSSFSEPVLKVIGGLVVLSLGYIHLELELLRVK